jgi:hypothetical protein
MVNQRQPKFRRKRFKITLARHHLLGPLWSMPSSAIVQQLKPSLASKFQADWRLDAGFLYLPIFKGNHVSEVAVKAEPQACPGCGAAAQIDRLGSRWMVLCSKKSKVTLGGCQKTGHTMLSRKDAIRVWNELK